MKIPRCSCMSILLNVNISLSVSKHFISYFIDNYNTYFLYSLPFIHSCSNSSFCTEVTKLGRVWKKTEVQKIKLKHLWSLGDRGFFFDIDNFRRILHESYNYTKVIRYLQLIRELYILTLQLMSINI